MSEALRITPMGVRQHLDGLTREGFVRFEWQKKGRGRPNQVFSLTEAGDELFPRTYGELALGLLEEIQATLGNTELDALFARRLEKVHAEYEARLAGKDLEGRVSELAKIRDEEGYLASWEKVDEDTFILTEHNCPVCRIAARFRQPCRAEAELFHRLLGGATVRREEYLVAGAQRCRYRIERQQSAD